MKSLGGKYASIYTNELKNGQVSFVITYRNETGKNITEGIGKSPEMTKTKALNILNERKARVRELKNNIKKGTSNPFALNKKKKVEDNLYTLNNLADFYFEDNKVATTKAMQTRYNYHVRDEHFANTPIISLIANMQKTEEVLKEFLDKKLLQRSDKKRSGKEKDIEPYHKDFLEIQKNNNKIIYLEKMAKEDPKKFWREQNLAIYLKKKNEMLIIRNDAALIKKLEEDRSIPTSEKRLIFGLLSHKTIKEMQDLCITIVNYAIAEKGLAITNPFEIFKKKRFKLRIDNIRDRYLTKDEIKVLLKEVKHIKETQAKHKNIYLMCLLALTLAARQSTLLGIKVGDIDLENGTIKLNNQKEEKFYTGHVAGDEIKNEIKELTKDKTASDFLFLNRNGTRPHRIPRKVQEILDYTVNYKREWTERLKIKDFRNTVASQLVMRGVPIEQVSQVLDHADIKITQRYAKLAKNSAKKEIGKMISDFLS